MFERRLARRSGARHPQPLAPRATPASRGWSVAARPGAWLGAWLVLAALLLAACGSEEEEALVIQAGDRVAVHYTGTLDDGAQFDSSAGRDPLEFVVGTGAVIDGFDQAVLGMAVGDEKTVRLAPAEAYGEHRDDLVIAVPLDAAPEGLNVGDRVTLAGGRPATVVSIDDTEVQVDANHDLAGQTLTFTIEVVDITRDAG